ncbi:potassium-transporting ATPase subunit KdpB, partial [Myxococcota bacterium]|nr:potassium-transporting ATPase subunit KdpB [Myxococcota bacterium]
PELLAQGLRASVVGMHPRRLAKSPVMFTVGVGAGLCGTFALRDAQLGQPWGDDAAIALILLLTVQLATFAEGLAEARGRAQAGALRATRSDTIARRLTVSGEEERVPSTALRPGDRVIVSAGEVIPGDGEVVRGAATVDESAITGESAPVLREAGTDRSGVTGGTRVLSDEIELTVTAQPGDSFLDRMIKLVEGAERQPTPNELALGALLTALTLVFLIVCATLPSLAAAVGAKVEPATVVALFVCLVPTTIGGLLPAIGIAGMDRALQANVLAKSGRAIEIAGDIDLMLLDKTGTITLGARQARRLVALGGVAEARLREAATLASLEDPTPEGRSIVALAGEGVAAAAGATFVPFSASTRMSGVDLPDGRRIRKGAVSAIAAWIEAQGGAALSAELGRVVEEIARRGGTPLVVAEGPTPLGVIALVDVLKPGMKERFARLREMGIQTVMVTGDNPLTAAAIATEAGVDGFIAEATPEAKLQRVRDEQNAGKLVAMTGDGTNDAPALAQADLGLAMNAGTQAAKEAANLIDLDSDPTKLAQVVEIGKQLLSTRGALTTFSLANDVAKYFVLLPAMFAVSLPGLDALNVLHLSSPRTALYAALLFNALILPALVPLALRGVALRAESAEARLTRSLLIYGGGGLVTPFVGIKLLDLGLSALGLS